MNFIVIYKLIKNYQIEFFKFYCIIFLDDTYLIKMYTTTIKNSTRLESYLRIQDPYLKAVHWKII